MGATAPRTATILCVDVPASVLEAARADAVTVRQLRSELHDLVSNVVDGTEVAVVDRADPTVVVFWSVAAGVEAAIALMRAARSLSSSSEDADPLPRCSLTIGDVVLDGDRPRGPDVARAMQLCDSARPGQIAATEAVRLVAAGRSNAVRFNPAMLPTRSAQFDGVEILDIEWDPLKEVEDDGGGLVGRAKERRLIRSALDAAVTGRTTAVEFVGPPGSGRTTLLTYAARVAKARGFRSLSMHGRDHDVTSFATARTMLQRVSDPALLAILRANAPFFFGDESNGDAAPAVQLVRALTAASQESPLVVTIDELGALDEGSSRAVRFALDHLAGERCCLFTAAEEGDPGRLPGESVSLGPLEDEGQAAIIDRDGPIDALVLERCIRLADGNPLAARELSRSLTADQRAGAVPLPAVPKPSAAISNGFRRLLASASERARRAAVVVACDDTGSVDVVRAALDFLGEPDDGLEEGETSGILRIEGPQVDFTHPLLRPVAYHQVAPSSRRAAHQALALTLTRPDQAVARAQQMAAAAVGHDDDAADALELVHHADLRRGHDVAAARAITRSSALTSDTERRNRRNGVAALAWLRAGSTRRARDVVEETLESAVALECLVARTLVRAATRGPIAAVDLLDQLQRAGLSTESAAIAAGLRVDQRALSGDLERLTADRDDAFARAALAQAGQMAADQLRSEDTTSFAPVVRGLVHVRIAQALLQAGWAVEAERLLGSVSGEELLSTDATTIASLRAACQLELGQPLVAHQLLRDSGPSHDDATAGRCLHRLESARVHLFLGRLDEAETAVAHAAADADRLGLGMLRLACDHVDALTRHARGGDAVELLRSPARLQPHLALADLVMVLVERDRSPEAQQHQRRLEPLAGSPDPAVRIRATRAIGLLHRDLTMLAAATEEADRHGLELEACLTNGAMVSASITAGQPMSDDVVVESIRRCGRAGFSYPGAHYWDSTEPSTPRALELLTPAEHRVAVAVARGATNKEAAGELFVSIKTVDFHLQNIYRKLDIRSRTELAVMVVGAGPGTEAR